MDHPEHFLTVRQAHDFLRRLLPTRSFTLSLEVKSHPPAGGLAASVTLEYSAYSGGIFWKGTDWLSCCQAAVKHFRLVDPTFAALAVAIAIVGYHIYQNNKTPVTTGGSDAGSDRPQ